MKVLLVLTILFFLSTTAIWLYLDRSPPPWDDSFYLTNSLNLYDALVEGGVPAYAKTFLTAMGSKPPLIAVLPTPLYLIAGRHPRAAYSINLMFLFVTFAALYQTAKKFCTPVAGWLAVYIAGTMPMVYGLSRSFLVECGLTAFVCVAICLLTEFEPGTNTWKIFLLSVTCGLGLLMKASFLVYIAVPFFFVATHARSTLYRKHSLLALGIPVALIALPWYLFNLRHALGTALNAGSPGTAAAYGTGGIFSPAAVKIYLINLLNTGPAIYFLILPILLVIQWRVIGANAKKGLLLCGLWGAPILFLIFGHYRELRYAAPLLPALAVALAILSDSMIRSRARWVVYGFLTLPLLSMLQGSFHLFGERSFELGGLLLNVPRFSYARAYDRAVWPNEEILSDISRLEKFAVGETRSLIVGTDTLHFNADNLRLVATEKRLPLTVSTTAYDLKLAPLIHRVNAASYFIYEQGGQDSAPFNAFGKNALQAVRESGKFAELPITHRLPDGGTAHVFENLSMNGLVESGGFVSGGLDGTPSCDVAFADRVRLTGFAVEQTPEGMRISYRWQCVNPLDREYWCFTHVLDEGGHIVRNLDHRILHGRPPITAWKPGDVAIESILVQVPETNLRVSVGLFDVPSGNRLTIVHSTLPLGENQTAVIVREPPAAH